MIKVEHLTAEDFKEGKLKAVFPEVYNLQKIVENTESGMHKDQSAFEHTLAVFEHLKKALKTMRLPKQREKKILNVLAEQIQNYDGWQLLLYAALLHDIGKKFTIRKQGKYTFASGHELKSAEMLPKFKYRFGFGAQDLKYLERIVKHHSDVYQLVRNISKDEKNLQKYWKPFKKQFRKHTYGLLLLSYADLLGSSLQKTDRKEFVKRSLCYKKLMGMGS
ncbi:MAG: HD domain-containing protein [Nanoarchaeota archaeon]|nr:MAG: HD domain-containing protein [Nanoarchaeota archaeon]